MKLFDYDGGFIRSASTLSRLTLLNILWMICCIPVITAGAATVGQYYAVNKLREGDTHICSNFKQGMILYWKKGTAVWIVQAVLIAAFIVSNLIVFNSPMPSGTILSAISGLAFLTMALVSLWIYPIMMQFSGSLKDIIFNAFIFAFMYAPLTIIVTILYGGAAYLSFRFLIARGLILVFGPTLLVYTSFAFFEKAFMKYKNQEGENAST